MSWTFKTKVGNGMLEVTEQDFKAIWSKASLIGDFPTECGKCGSKDIAPMHKTPKGVEYFGLKCKACGAEQTFHQKKEGGFYIRFDDEWTKYGESQEQTVKKVFEGEKEEFKDDIPF
jgi:hypothetical protein